MKKFFYLSIIFLLYSCMDKVQVTLEEGRTQLVVDAWITTEYDTQIIKLRETKPYFESSLATGVSGASVVVRDLINDRTISFVDASNTGNYIWIPPTPSDTFQVRPRTDPKVRESGGYYDAQYQLDITLANGASYFSLTSIERPIKIDSLHLERREEQLGENAGIYAELFARDIPGLGDCYWIRTYKNGQFLNKGSEINVAYDGSFSEGSDTDGLYFIPPIREAVNPVNDNNAANDVPPYQVGDRIDVKVWSITEVSFLYLRFLQQELNNQGLFATPPANLFSNITSQNPLTSPSAVGFFSGAGITSISVVVPENVPFDDD